MAWSQLSLISLSLLSSPLLSSQPFLIFPLSLSPHLQARKAKRGGDSREAVGNMSETVEPADVVAILCPQYKDRPQLARVVQRTSSGYNIRWLSGSYNSSWTEAKRREGRKLVPWLDTIKESDIIYKKLPLTASNKLTHKLAQTLRVLYAAKVSSS